MNMNILALAVFVGLTGCVTDPISDNVGADLKAHPEKCGPVLAAGSPKWEDPRWGNNVWGATLPQKKAITAFSACGGFTEGKSKAEKLGVYYPFIGSSTPIEFGRVIDAQNRAIGSPGTGGAGAQLGSAYGQTTYLDNTSIENYKASNQVAAGVAGALVGALLDSGPDVRHEVHYWVKIGDESVEISGISPSGAYIPKDVCVKVTGRWFIEPTSDADCKGKS